MTELIKVPPSWLKQGISSLMTGVVLIGGMLATGVVDWKQAEVSEQGVISESFVALVVQLRMDVAELRSQVRGLEAERRLLSMQRDSMTTRITDLTNQNTRLHRDVYFLTQKVEDLESARYSPPNRPRSR